LNNDLVQYLNPHKKTYGIGTQIYVIGMTYLESSPLVRTARPYLSLLADKYQKTTFVSRRKGDRVVCIYKYTSPHAQAKTSGIGNQKLLHSTAIGKCYLAFDKTAAPLVDAIELTPVTPYTITCREKLRAQIEEFRREGYAWEKRESCETMSCLAAPVFDGEVMLGAISMTGYYVESEDFASQGNEIAHLARIISSQVSDNDK